MSSSKEAAVDIITPTEKTIGQLKILNSSILPVHYGAQFYECVISNPDYFCFVVIFNDIMAGGITGRKLKNDKTGQEYLYIMTFAVLPAYRERGLGTKLLQKLESVAQSDKSLKYIELHVQIGNDEALKYYQNRGYSNVEFLEKYYRKVTPSGAHRLTKQLE